MHSAAQLTAASFTDQTCSGALKIIISLVKRRARAKLIICALALIRWVPPVWQTAILHSNTQRSILHANGKWFGSAIPKGRQSSPNPNPSMRVLVGFMGREPLGMADRHPASMYIYYGITTGQTATPTFTLIHVLVGHKYAGLWYELVRLYYKFSTSNLWAQRTTKIINTKIVETRSTLVRDFATWYGSCTCKHAITRPDPSHLTLHWVRSSSAKQKVLD